MKTIIVSGYLAGLIHHLITSGIVQYFGKANREAYEEIMEVYKPYNLNAKRVYLISSIIMFAAMILTALLWPVGLLWNLWIRIKVKYLFWKTMKMMKKLEKELKELFGEDF